MGGVFCAGKWAASDMSWLTHPSNRKTMGERKRPLVSSDSRGLPAAQPRLIAALSGLSSDRCRSAGFAGQNRYMVFVDWRAGLAQRLCRERVCVMLLTQIAEKGEICVNFILKQHRKAKKKCLDPNRCKVYFTKRGEEWFRRKENFTSSKESFAPHNQS